MHVVILTECIEENKAPKAFENPKFPGKIRNALLKKVDGDTQIEIAIIGMPIKRFLKIFELSDIDSNRLKKHCEAFGEDQLVAIISIDDANFVLQGTLAHGYHKEDVADNPDLFKPFFIANAKNQQVVTVPSEPACTLNWKTVLMCKHQI